MATSGAAYGISVAIYFVILVLVFCFFSIWRRLSFSKKFYSPKLYTTEHPYTSPAPLGHSFSGWVSQVLRTSEAEIIGSAGIDAALYVKFLRMGWETFLVVSLLTLIIILPINLTNNTVDQLMATQAAPAGPVSPFTFWVPPPPPPVPPGEEPSDTPADLPETPQFYNDTDIPDPPEGLQWHKYANGVPALPPAPPNFTWSYASEYVPENYVFTDLDKTTLSNIPARSIKLVAHAIIGWVVTFVVFFQLWRYCKVALRLRLLHLLTTPKGAETHTILCTDIPGIAYGTIPNRLDGTLLKFVPRSVKKKAFAQVEALGGTRSGKTGEPPSCAGISDVDGGNSSRDGSWEIPDRWSEAVDRVKAAGGTTPANGTAVESMVSDEFRKVYQSDFNQVGYLILCIRVYISIYDVLVSIRIRVWCLLCMYVCLLA